MENAVIYARFSSHGQNEQSIEGQIRFCREFAENQGYHIVNTYHDKARTGTNDSRPAFQKMINDAAGEAFQYILVYMFDRFARNRRDSIMYKEMLKEEYGIKVISATQPISDDEGGEFYEMFLEWNDEKYSKRLSKRVRGGLDISVENGTFSGGYLIYGYKKVPSEFKGKKGNPISKLAIDEEQAAIVRYVFTEYDKGITKKDIAEALNAKGLRLKGKPFTGKSFDKWDVNPKYTGEFYFGERLCTNMYPAIIDKALFERVQKRLNKNKYFAGGVATARVPYLLTGKAVCEHCETPMVSDGGTSKTGKQHHYYACKKAKKRDCDKHRNEKNALELYVTECVRDFLSDPENAEIAVTDTLAHYDQRTGGDSIRSIEAKIAHTQKDVEEMTNAFIEAKSALLRASIEKKMIEYEKLLKDLTDELSQLEFERGLQITKKDLLAFIAEILSGDPNDKEYQRKLIDNLVINVFVSDGHDGDDGHKIVMLNLNGGKSVERGEINAKEVIDAANKVLKGVQSQFPPSRQIVLKPSIHAV